MALEKVSEKFYSIIDALPEFDKSLAWICPIDPIEQIGKEKDRMPDKVQVTGLRPNIASGEDLHGSARITQGSELLVR